MTNNKSECYSCGGKGFYTQMHGEYGADDFGGEGYEVKPTIHKYPCKSCNGTGLTPKVATSEKGECKGGICQIFDTFPPGYGYCDKHTPHESEDWSEDEFIFSVARFIEHRKSIRELPYDDYVALKDFIRQEKFKSYQRGREEGFEQGKNYGK